MLPLLGLFWDKISLHIQSRSRSLSKLSEATSKQLWAAVKPSVSSKTGNSTLVDRILSDVDKVSDYFAGISYLPGCASGLSLSVGSASPMMTFTYMILS